jgi:hypothetical protein
MIVLFDFTKYLKLTQSNDDPPTDLGATATDLEQAQNESDDWVTLDTNSCLIGHKMENGHMYFQDTQTMGNVSLHSYAWLSGQTIGPNVTLGVKSRVSFSNHIKNEGSGFYLGIPAIEVQVFETV